MELLQDSTWIGVGLVAAICAAVLFVAFRSNSGAMGSDAITLCPQRHSPLRSAPLSPEAVNALTAASDQRGSEARSVDRVA
jgi:hypothetical protein